MTEGSIKKTGKKERTNERKKERKKERQQDRKKKRQRKKKESFDRRNERRNDERKNKEPKNKTKNKNKKRERRKDRKNESGKTDRLIRKKEQKCKLCSAWGHVDETHVAGDCNPPPLSPPHPHTPTRYPCFYYFGRQFLLSRPAMDVGGGGGGGGGGRGGD